MLILEIDEELGLDVVVVNVPEFARVEVKNLGLLLLNFKQFP